MKTVMGYTDGLQHIVEIGISTRVLIWSSHRHSKVRERGIGAGLNSKHQFEKGWMFKIVLSKSSKEYRN
ncbi:hypothetical protein TNIN_414851 [Trichonephila inaurata madagascariensis]|uniref:Uncharacterized protein n=1 Tax=Trichonephila inaurata madagascariensis TaxID=2747483 RepID=A0A8X6J5I2_9ARAC|nr:hypothetical protein TNIN_414851 [Trichonephila inaurata madagascariensis]